MARFERSKSKRDSRGSTPKKGGRNRQSFGDGPRGRRDSNEGYSKRGSSRGNISSGREFQHNRRGSNHGRNRRELEMTKVICSDCKKECEVPFKPTSSKPVYCSDCFKKKGGSDRSSNLDVINEKLDKIMKALKIE